MDKNELSARLRQIFLTELSDRVGDMTRCVAELEALAGPEETGQALDTLFRAAHSLKGAASMAGVGPVEKVCHVLEDLLSQAKAGTRRIDAALCEVTLEAADGIAAARDRLAEHGELSGDVLAPVLQRLTHLYEQTSPESASKADAGAGGILPGAVLGPGASQAGEPSLEPGELEPHTNLQPETEPSQEPSPGPSEWLGSGGSVQVSDGPRLEVQPTVALPPPEPPRPTAGRGPHALADDVRVSARRVEAVLAAGQALGRVQGRPQGWLEQVNELADMAREQVLLYSRCSPETVDHGQANLWSQFEHRLDRLSRELGAVSQDLVLLTERVNREAHSLRMQPFEDGCTGLDRAVRDAARECGKQVRFKLVGGDVEMDRAVLAQLRDPLTHLVRNAVDHGIESPQDRVAAGKSARGRIQLEVGLRNAHVVVQVSDDGRGLDAQALRAAARKRGLPEPQTDADAYTVIFEPGLSTAKSVTSLSGRGVGMDVVRAQLEQLHGDIRVLSNPGAGTRFDLKVPLTLTNLRVLTLVSGGVRLAISASNVLAVRAPASERDAMGLLADHLEFEGELLPVAGLQRVLGQSAPTDPTTEQLVVVTAEHHRSVLLVDEVVATQDLTIRSFGRRIKQLKFLSGAGIQRNGELVGLINAAAVVRAALGSRATSRPLASQTSAPRVLVVDDSLTTRAFQKITLEGAGFRVWQAADGEDAWQILQQEPFDLVISDIEMPHIGGLRLTEMIRNSPTLRSLPIILVTSLAKESDRLAGLRAGANAYIVKSDFEAKSLIDTAWSFC